MFCTPVMVNAIAQAVAALLMDSAACQLALIFTADQWRYEP